MVATTRKNIRDLLDEELINVKELPDILEPRNGKKVHLAAIYRWIKSGLSGVKLETIIIANGRFTTREALNRFWVRVTEARDGLQAQADAIAPPKKSATKKHF